MAKLKLIETENDVKALVKGVFDEVGAWSYAPIQNGLGVHGIPDRVGCVPVTITPEMVGRTVGLFVAVEAKRPGRRGEKNAGATGAQVNILREIIDAGGMAMLCDGESDIEYLSDVLKNTGVWMPNAVEWRACLDSRVTKDK